MYPRFLLFVIFVIFDVRPSFAQVPSSNSFSEGLCGASSCITGSSAAGVNPAGVAFADLSAGIGYSDRFMMKELSQKSLWAAVPVLGGVFSTGFDYYGFSLFNTTRASLGYARQLSRTLCAGINLNYHQVHVDDSPANARTVSGDAGVICRPAKSLLIGTYIRNISNSQYPGGDTILPAQIQAGIAYSFYGGHVVCVDVDKSSLVDGMMVHVGAIARMTECAKILVGASSQPFTVGFGAEFSFRSFVMQFAARRSQYLGWIPSVSLCWRRGGDRGWEQDSD